MSEIITAATESELPDLETVIVARGATNKEAGAALYLSPKTIETHLGRVYRKLGVRTRTELAVLLARDESLESRSDDHSLPAGSAIQLCSPSIFWPSRRCTSGVRSECAMPRPAVIKFIAPGWISWMLPSLSRCMMLPSNR